MISRNSSGTLAPKMNIENLCASLSQKDKIILILQKQLEGFRNIRENYERLKDRKNQLLDKCQTLSRQISISRGNQDIRIDNNQKYVIQLRVLVSNLENQLQNKQYQLKDLKYEAESLIKSSQQRQNDLLSSGQSIDSIKSSMEILKMQSNRLYGQITQMKQQIQRIKNYQIQTESARQKIKGQIHSTQAFIRQLGYQESKLSESLSNLEDQNNSIDEIIQDLKKVLQMTKVKMRDAKDEKQQYLLKIKTKQLEKGRVQAEFNERSKQLKNERQKQKIFKQTSQSKRAQVQRLASILKQMNEQSDELVKQSLDIESINGQLQKDLATCKKHLQNVSKSNLSVKGQLEGYYKTNIVAIKKLRKPLDQGWIELGTAGKETDNLDTADGFMEKSV